MPWTGLTTSLSSSCVTQHIATVPIEPKGDNEPMAPASLLAPQTPVNEPSRSLSSLSCRQNSALDACFHPSPSYVDMMAEPSPSAE